jgi:SAM-dependent methyltransferase
MNTERHYTGDAGKSYHQKKRGIPPIAIPWVARLRAEKIQPHVRPADTVFEFGAGAGWNLLSLHCARRFAYDISEFAGANHENIEWTRDLNIVSPGSVEVVICHHALEHLLNPAEALSQIHHILRPSGLLLIFVPYEKERRYRQFNPSEPNHHLFSWNVQTLGNLVTECHFNVISASVDEFGYDRFAATLAARWKMGESGFRFLRRLAHILKPASEVRLVARRPQP